VGFWIPFLGYKVFFAFDSSIRVLRYGHTMDGRGLFTRKRGERVIGGENRKGAGDGGVNSCEY